MDYEFYATITDCFERDSKWFVSLDKNNFYPGGGGQPADRGTITGKGFSGKVVGIEGKHLVVEGQGKLEKGMKVAATIDWKRRLLFTRTHTGEHILFKAIQQQAPDLKLKKMEIMEEGLCIIEAGGDLLDWEKLRKAEALANKTIQESRQVKEEWIDKADAATHPELRIRPERIEGNSVRVITVDGFDTSACAGTHCTNSSEINGVVVLSFNQAGGNYRIGFRADLTCWKTIEEVLKLAAGARESASVLSVGAEQLPFVVKNLLEEKEQLKKQVRELGKGVKVNEETINNIRFVWQVLDGFDRKQVQELGASLLKEKTVVCLVSKGESSQAIIFVSKDLELGANDLLKEVLEKFGGKGGGGKDFASGGVPVGKELEVLEVIRASLKN